MSRRWPVARIILSLSSKTMSKVRISGVVLVIPSISVQRAASNAQPELVCSVYARVRPSSPVTETAPWELTDTVIACNRASSRKEYLLDGVFAPASDTEQVYAKSTRHLIKPVLDGFSCTIFAYGQTASGKTFTMRGTDSEPGIIQYAVRDLFEGMESDRGRNFCVRVSYLEVRLSLASAEDRMRSTMGREPG
jgi:Kinesin motor domain